jgi:soluble lytic murein transglycosylase-like protein
MRKAYLLASLALIVSSTAFAQERPRVLDNFNIAKGVSVYRTEYMPIAAKNKLAKNTKNSKATAKLNTVDAKLSTTGKPLVRPTTMSAPVKQTNRTVRMNVDEGLADGEMSNAKYSKLLMNAAPHLRGFTTGDVLIDSYIVDSSRRYGIDPLLIYSQMHQESSFKLRATSNKGASGLMQLMPATARRLGVTNIYDPKQNIEGGVKYMRMLMDMFGGDVSLALAGYNAGEGAVQKYGNTIPPYTETREYVRRISARYASISDGSFARHYKKVNSSTAARLEQKEARPLTLEQNAVAIRLPDGRLRLVNQ